MTKTNLKPCPFCGGKAHKKEAFGQYTFVCSVCGIVTEPSNEEEKAIKIWNTRQDNKVKYESTSYSCRACKNATDSEIKRLREENKKYEDVLLEICFCCAAVDCSLEQQSEALKAIDTICKEFYSIPKEVFTNCIEREE